MKKFIRNIVPYGVIDWYRELQVRRFLQYKGDFPSWKAAESRSDGYDAENIILKVKNATEQIIAGKAVYERDSFLFYREDFHWPLLTVLLQIAIQNHGSLHILDFGGALGSTYWQNRKILDRSIPDLSWHIVEQETYMKAAKELVYDAPLFFHPTIQKALDSCSFHVVLFSSVLQYLPDPFYFLKEAASIPYLIIDRHPEFLEKTESQITVQHVGNEIYSGSYPVKIYGKNELQSHLSRNYQILYNWESAADKTHFLKDKNQKNQIHYTGFCLKKI